MFYVGNWPGSEKKPGAKYSRHDYEQYMFTTGDLIGTNPEYYIDVLKYFYDHPEHLDKEYGPPDDYEKVKEHIAWELEEAYKRFPELRP